jgi:diacylglycerol kinase (ATP)
MVAAFAKAAADGREMKIAPKARRDHGKLDVCVVSDMGKCKLVCLFPTIYFGRHLHLPQVDAFQAERLRLETEYPLEVYADGEYVCQTPIEASVAARALSVIVP